MGIHCTAIEHVFTADANFFDTRTCVFIKNGSLKAGLDKHKIT